MCPIFTNPPDWLKLSQWCKNSSFTVEIFKIFAGGLLVPAPTRPARVGGKMISWREGGAGGCLRYTIYSPEIWPKMLYVWGNISKFELKNLSYKMTRAKVEM